MKLDREQQNDGDTNVVSENPFYIFEIGDQHMIGLPVVDDQQFTNNIVQFNTKSLDGIPEIDIINMTRNTNGARIITRHNYQLKSDQQNFINKLIASAVNHSIEEHSETVTQLSTSSNFKDQSGEFTGKSNNDLTSLVDVYAFDRLTERTNIRTRNMSTMQSNIRARYDLRDATLRQSDRFTYQS